MTGSPCDEHREHEIPETREVDGDKLKNTIGH